MLVDTHAHLFWESFKEDYDLVLKTSIESGVNNIINVGVDLETSSLALAQAEQNYPNLDLYSSIALHPEEAIKYFNQENKIDDDIKKLEKIYLKNPQKVIAVGECGLDFSYFNRDGYLPIGINIEKAKDLQRKLFKAQIELAKKLNLPLLIHCRDDRTKNLENSECWDEVIELTKDWFGIYHCYSGLMLTTKSILENTKFLISFAGNLTYPKNIYLQEAVKIIPLEKIVLETDCPFLAPQHIRGQRNEPSTVKVIAEKIAEIKDISFEEVSTQTTQNFKNLFKF